MSYKHNNLMAMRQTWWDDQGNPQVKQEKDFLQQILTEKGVYPESSIEDVRYFFFTLPSIIIVKGYAFGFNSPQVEKMILQHIETNHQMLRHRVEVKIQFRMT